MKVQVHRSSEPPLQYNQTPDAFYKTRPIMAFLANLGVLNSFRLVLKWTKEIPESLRLEFLEKFSPSNFALSDKEQNI